MVHVPVTVMKESLQLCSRLLDVFLSVLIDELVTIVSTHSLKRVSEWQGTSPAELMVTLATSHMVTSTVLLNDHMALRTVLSVRTNIVESFCVIFVFTLHFPFIEIVTENRFMPFVAAQEAELSMTGTSDRDTVEAARSFDLSFSSSNQFVTVRVRTPLETTIVADEVVRDQLPVLGLDFGIFDKMENHFIVNQERTVSRTRDVVSFTFIHDLHCQVRDPTLTTKGMSTGQSLQFSRIHRIETDETEVDTRV